MGQPKHVLVVDDDGDVLDVIVALLEENNFRVSSAASGSLMRDFLQTADPVDSVVLDALMPGEAGISLALKLKEVGLPVVVISGSQEAMERAVEEDLQSL
jgi:two-component system, OmpR family, response regulator